MVVRREASTARGCMPKGLILMRCVLCGAAASVRRLGLVRESPCAGDRCARAAPQPVAHASATAEGEAVASPPKTDAQPTNRAMLASVRPNWPKYWRNSGVSATASRMSRNSVNRVLWLVDWLRLPAVNRYCATVVRHVPIGPAVERRIHCLQSCVWT